MSRHRPLLHQEPVRMNVDVQIINHNQEHSQSAHLRQGKITGKLPILVYLFIVGRGVYEEFQY